MADKASMALVINTVYRGEQWSVDNGLIIWKNPFRFSPNRINLRLK